MTKKSVEIVAGIKAGMKNVEIAEELGVHRNSVSYHLKKLRGVLQEKAPTEFAEFVQQQVGLLTQLIDDVYAGKVPSDRANAINGLMQRLSKLTGSDKPSRSLSVALHGTITEFDPATPVNQLSDGQLAVVLAREFITLSSEQLDEALVYLRALPRQTKQDQADEELARQAAEVEVIYQKPAAPYDGPAVVDVEFKDGSDDDTSE